MSDRFDFIVVGGGVLGASSVLAVKEALPDAKIVWYTGTKEHTASNDFMKIIRDVYPDELTAQFANRALRTWTTDDLYRRNFHNPGWIRVLSDNETVNTADTLLTTAEMVRRVGCTKPPILNENEKLYLNPTVGYADSAQAVDDVAEMVEERGVKVIRKNVTSFLVDGGECLGVQVEDLFKASGVSVGILDLRDEEFEELKDMPILVTDIGEVMLSHKKKVLKMTTTKTFMLNDPDRLPKADTCYNRKVLEKVLPQFEGRELRSFTCPDLLTPNQDPVIDHVPGAQGLVVATGGSYHSFKFLPEIGKMVFLRIRNQEPGNDVESELLQRWTWNRTGGGPHPVHELDEVGDILLAC
ncbi:hypothetical protein GE09DRAFT_1066661 [Coniochaeta sp. 2T2.1]|nr:hypothetical protein GE09DRAFT_1066661 [Coniochaeta sp. 2T2.1]